MYINFFQNRLTQSPKCILNYTKSDSINKILVSVVIPIHNQASILYGNLRSLFECISLDCEIILIDDSSSDHSVEEVLRAIKADVPDTVQSLTFYSFKYPIYESACDDFAIRKAKGEYIIELQADMKIMEQAFDSKMLKVLHEYTDIFMLSGRGVMNFEEITNIYRNSRGTESSMSKSVLRSIFRNLVQLFNVRSKLKSKEEIVLEEYTDGEFTSELIFPKSEQFVKTGRAGRLGRLIEVLPKSESENIYIGETVMRGPICFQTKRYIDLGGLNLNSFFLGYDEHDLNLRARIEKGWKAAFMYVAFSSPLMHGSMRKKRSLISKLELYLVTKRINRSQSNVLSKYEELRSSFISNYEVRKVLK